MECDSMHAAIEFAKKKPEIFVPRQWATVIRMARRKYPYMIVPLKFGDIYDFKDFTKKYMKFMIQSQFSWVYLIHLICNQFTFCH
jgi:hypothetical protein